MEKLEKVELVREKCGVTYEEAKNALEACDYDVLDAIVKLEREGKAQAATASYATFTEAEHHVSPEMTRAQAEYHESSKKTKVGDLWTSLCAHVKEFINAGFEMTFIAEREGERVVALPLLILLIGMFIWGISIWLLIIGLFFGFRYRIEGASPLTIDVNEAMDKVADVAEGIRSDLKKDE